MKTMIGIPRFFLRFRGYRRGQDGGPFLSITVDLIMAGEMEAVTGQSSVECNGFPHLSHFPALQQCEATPNFIGLYYLNNSSTCQAKKLNQSSIFRNLFLSIFVIGVYY